MPRSLIEWTLWLVGIGVPFLLARSRRGSDMTTLAVVVAMLTLSAHVLLAPAALPGEAAVALLILVGAQLVNVLGGPSMERRLVAWARSRPAKAALAVAAATLVPLAFLEQACRVLTDLKVIGYQRGIETVNQSRSDDWRMATITGAEAHEPDPVLLWRHAPTKPFSAQRFKGPLIEVPKPPEVVRVMCYGDSLTDGPPRGGWPTYLAQLLKRRPPLPGRRFEVVNAGVAGYSSYQGTLRFLQEVEEYDPDLVLVSFGWNDAAEAIGQPDKSFRVPPLALVACQRALVRYRSYLVLMYYSRHLRIGQPAPAVEPVGPRVSIADYVANLDRFRDEAEVRGIPIVFLTRPHRLPANQQAKFPTWRGTVPRYNEALLAWARSHGLRVIDTQKFFERQPAASFVDECHFRPEGYLRMGELVYQELVSGAAGPLVAAAERLGRETGSKLESDAIARSARPRAGLAGN
jgi:lysophospholipase L1-like esterase